MDTRYLDSFLQVAHLGSTAAAARKLNLTPTAVAQRIKALEHEIGQPLLSRAGRNMQLTAAGSALIGPAEELLKRTLELRAIAALDAVVGDLRIGCITTGLAYLVPKVLSTLINNFEHLRPHVEPAISTDLYRKVLAGDIDIALLVAPQFDLPKEFIWRPIRDEPFIVLAPKQMANHDPHDVLRNEPFIRYHRRSWGGALVDRYLQEHRIQPRERFEIDALDAIAGMVKGNLGVSLVPQWRPMHVRLDDLAQISLPDSSMSRPIGLLWKRNSAKQRLIDVFCEVMFEQLQII
ncbi:LysR family transcriptional regulator [Pseudomonas syringae pv. dysoxyli]|uniref:LysR family transcriptional regulator n=1 Tax=Pseudomonas syringae TaxID=317 RepID=UPI001373349C|nr:LysR family transcriptional regulator [Pseudomonas syringae]NAO28814.1 LysR family transcriptional regulator [Pseudomonas syringae pv. dysoxyli]